MDLMSLPITWAIHVTWKMRERQFCEQLVDVDEPHADQMNPMSNSMMNSESHAEAWQYLNNKHLQA
jgi:hypothetical protein